jgi:hypothetical protein
MFENVPKKTVFHCCFRANSAHARQSRLSDKDLDMLNIGRFKRTWTKTEQMQALPTL